MVNSFTQMVSQGVLQSAGFRFCLHQAWRSLFILLIAGCTSTELTSAESAPREIIADGRCPDLSGTYREDGISIHGNKSRTDAHFSWLISGEKVRMAMKPLNTMPAPGKPSIYFVQTIRVFHPEPGWFTLEALGREGESMGFFDFGPKDGWQCGEQAFFVYRKDRSGGEGTWGDRISLHKIYRAADGAIVRSVREWYHQHSIFAAGGAVGLPKIVDVEYRFASIDR